MSIGRGGRPSQVRPRPPSTGRPQPVRGRSRASSPGRFTPPRGVVRGPSLPLASRLLLAAAVVLLGVAVLFAATGGLGKIVGSLGSAVAGALDRVSASPSPSPSPALALEPPTLTAPSEPYTNQATVDLSGTIPSAFVGQTDIRIRLYVTFKGKPPLKLKEQAVGLTPTFTFPGIALAKGVNDFSVALVGPDGESDPSPVVSYVLDTAPPTVTITAPKDGAVINAGAVTITGKTQSRSSVSARNEANNATSTTEAAGDGTFSVTIPLVSGTNGITITVNDPAGNTTQRVISVKRGTGALTAALRANRYRYSAAKLPAQLTLTTVVTDPNGAPVDGATVTFTVSIPGIPTLTFDATTDGTGTATFTTTIPKGATVGSGPATVLVTTTDFGQTTGRTVLSIDP